MHSFKNAHWNVNVSIFMLTDYCTDVYLLPSSGDDSASHVQITWLIARKKYYQVETNAV